MPPTMQIKRGTAAALASVNPTPLAGELVWDTTNNTLRVGNGSSAYSSLAIVSATPSSHTHAASDITSGTFDAARLPLATTGAAGAVIVGTGLGVSSGTVSVTYGTNSTSACRGDDSRLSDTRTPTDGSVTTAKIANDAVTFAKLQNVSATDRLLGRSSAGAGDVEEITCTSTGRAIIGAANEAAARSAISVQPTASPAFTGTVSAAAANFTGAVSVTSPLTLTGTVAGNVRSLKLQTSGSDRWQITPSFDAETGSNAGSNFHITRWSDAGSFMGTPLYITRSTGVVNCESGLTIVSGQLLVTAGSASACGVAFSGDTNTGLAQLGGADTASLVTAGVERLRIDASGNVGIGAAPGTTLDIQRASADAAVFVQGQTSSTGATVQMYSGAGIAYIGTRTNHPLLITTNNTERVRVDASGNMGVGISPSTLLHLKSLGVLRLQTGSVTMDCTPTAGATDSFVWNTSANCAYRWSMNGTQRMDITSAGEVLIGTTTDNGAYLLQVNSQIYATNATIATSDARFKTNVESLTDATAIIEALRPVAFDFIPHAERNFATERQVGLIAQEAQAALAGTDYADSVVAQCGDHLGLAYEKLVPVLIKALQESNARIAALEERLNHA